MDWSWDFFTVWFQERKCLSYLVASVGSSDGSINCRLSLTMLPKTQDMPKIFSQVLASTELAPQDTHCEPRVGIPHGQTPELWRHMVGGTLFQRSQMVNWAKAIFRKHWYRWVHRISLCTCFHVFFSILTYIVSCMTKPKNVYTPTEPEHYSGTLGSPQGCRGTWHLWCSSGLSSFELLPSVGQLSLPSSNHRKVCRIWLLILMGGL